MRFSKLSICFVELGMGNVVGEWIKKFSGRVSKPLLFQRPLHFSLAPPSNEIFSDPPPFKYIYFYHTYHNYHNYYKKRDRKSPPFFLETLEIWPSPTLKKNPISTLGYILALKRNYVCLMCCNKLSSIYIAILNFKFISRPTLFVGKHSGGLYAIPTLVDEKSVVVDVRIILSLW